MISCRKRVTPRSGRQLWNISLNCRLPKSRTRTAPYSICFRPTLTLCLLQAAREQDLHSWEDEEKEQLRQQVQALQAAAEQAQQQAAEQAQQAAHQAAQQAQQRAAESSAPRDVNSEAEAQLKARIAALEVG